VYFARFALSIVLPFADSQLWDTFCAGKVRYVKYFPGQHGYISRRGVAISHVAVYDPAIGNHD
jgi:hypothetical protein